MVQCFPLPFNNTLVFSADLIVEDLKIKLVAAGAETMHDGVICCNAILVLLSFEWGNEDGVQVIMISRHDVLVSTAGADVEVTSVIGVEF